MKLQASRVPLIISRAAAKGFAPNLGGLLSPPPSGHQVLPSPLTAGPTRRPPWETLNVLASPTSLPGHVSYLPWAVVRPGGHSLWQDLHCRTWETPA